MTAWRARGPQAPAGNTQEAPDWIAQARCRADDVNRDWWSEWHGYSLARHICEKHCPVRSECAGWAGQYPWTGSVVGGLLRTGRRASGIQPIISASGCPTCGGPPPKDRGTELLHCPGCGREVEAYRTSGLLARHKTLRRGGEWCTAEYPTTEECAP